MSAANLPDKSVKTGLIVANESGEVARFELIDSVFLSSFDADAKKGRAAHFNESDLQNAATLQTLKKIVLSKDHETKIVGSKKLTHLVFKLLESDDKANCKIVEREGALQILFYPEIGRVRVASSTVQKSVVHSKKVRVLIVDDSKTIRDLLQRIFSHDEQLQVVGATGEPLKVLELIRQLKPDVITMDIHMPDMDGCTLVKKVMEVLPTPTVMISSVSMEDGPAVLTALEFGAVDYIQKPSFSEIDAVIPVIIEKVKTAARANIQKIKKALPPRDFNSQPIGNSKLDTGGLVAIGSSTGGTEALRVFLTGLPADIPPMVIVQHIPPVFSAAFAQRMDKLCPFEVKEAEDGDAVLPGRVFIAPGGKQMEVVKKDGKLCIRIHDGPAVNRFKPSVDVLFNSVAAIPKLRVTGIILTGMGSDGAKGLLKLQSSGAHTVAQSERTCVVYGMPREAVLLGAADVSVDLDQISSHLIKALSERKKTA